LKKSNQENDHPVCWLALPHEGHSCLNRNFLCMTQKPTNLIVLQVRNAAMRRNSRELTIHQAFTLLCKVSIIRFSFVILPT
jgi:hypothetical protein